jgi:predicted esterase
MRGKLLLFGALLLPINSLATDIEREAEYARVIGEQLEIGEVIRLEAENKKFLAIYTETPQPNTQYAAILLHDKDGYPDQKPLIHSLRTTLPHHQWETLSIQTPVREKGAQAIDYLSLFPELVSRLKAANAYLKNKKIENVVLIGHGLGALMALYGQTQLKDQFKAVVAISLPVIDQPIQPEYQTVELLKKIEVPVLDLYGGLDRPEIMITANKRRLAAKENRGYRQDSLQFERTDSPDDEKLIVKRVYSWLRRQNYDDLEQ